jgi:hypothetical protein
MPAVDVTTPSARVLSPGVEVVQLPSSQRLWSGEPETYTLTLVLGGSSTWRIDGVERTTVHGGVRLKRLGSHFRTTDAPTPSALTVLRFSDEALRLLGGPRCAAHFAAGQVHDDTLTAAIADLVDTVGDGGDEAVAVVLAAAARPRACVIVWAPA